MLSHTSLLAHTIYRGLSFDAALADEGFTITDTSTWDAFESRKWPGVADTILGKKEWFEAWKAGEKKFAEDQYHEIISTPDAWQIAEDELTVHGTNPSCDGARSIAHTLSPGFAKTSSGQAVRIFVILGAGYQAFVVSGMQSGATFQVSWRSKEVPRSFED
ncbi:hypothetical protein IW262DRAFT_1013896 [Armillaria fumosa]|nr:hypothetical protein IW262DRAFT_1013896 [Armillaria fumosa]